MSSSPTVPPTIKNKKYKLATVFAKTHKKKERKKSSPSSIHGHGWAPSHHFHPAGPWPKIRVRISYSFWQKCSDENLHPAHASSDRGLDPHSPQAGGEASSVPPPFSERGKKGKNNNIAHNLPEDIYAFCAICFGWFKLFCHNTENLQFSPTNPAGHPIIGGGGRRAGGWRRICTARAPPPIILAITNPPSPKTGSSSLSIHLFPASMLSWALDSSWVLCLYLNYLLI